MEKQQVLENFLMIAFDHYVQKVLKIGIEDMDDVHEGDVFTGIFRANERYNKDYDIVQFHYVEDSEYIEMVQLKIVSDEDPNFTEATKDILRRPDDVELVKSVYIPVERFFHVLDRVIDPTV